MKTRLVFVRHGETNHNVQQRWQGWFQSKLSPRGRKQVKHLAKRLGKEKFDALYTSRLNRAIHTAQEIQKHHAHLKLRKRLELNERNFGVFEGLTVEEIKKAQPKQWEAYTHSKKRHLFAPEKGESWKDVHGRVMPFIDSILKQHAGETVLLVAHGGVNRIAVAALLGFPLWNSVQFQQNNTGITIVDVEEGKATLVKSNDTRHTYAPL